jgi:hypothetical protein
MMSPTVLEVASTDVAVRRNAFRRSAALLLAGVILSLVAGMFHPGRAPANDHAAAFAEYAQSVHWTTIHLGQFAGLAVVVVGLVMFADALRVRSGSADWSVRLGVVSAVIALALYGVLQAVDGVALKQAVDAWARAPQTEQAARFAGAEAIRWLEWGVRSYQSFMLGVSFVLFSVSVVRTSQVPAAVGYLMGLSGMAYIAQGWVIGSSGFSDGNTYPTLVALVLVLAWSVSLLVWSFKMGKDR